MTPLYMEEINMLEGLDDEELDNYLEENPQIVPLFEVDIIKTVGVHHSYDSRRRRMRARHRSIHGAPQGA